MPYKNQSGGIKEYRGYKARYPEEMQLKVRTATTGQLALLRQTATLRIV